MKKFIIFNQILARYGEKVTFLSKVVYNERMRMERECEKNAKGKKL